MTALSPPLGGTKTNVGMGQVAIGRAGDVLDAVLGSCIGLVLIHPRLRLAGLAHIVLPASNGRAAPPGKFADTAIPELLKLLACEGAFPSGLIAKVAGGSNMFGSASGPMQIGEANIAAVQALLATHQLRTTAKDVSGSKGRRIRVDCETGLVDVEIVGQAKTVL
jgi:chemotaxis protein CheD